MSWGSLRASLDGEFSSSCSWRQCATLRVGPRRQTGGRPKSQDASASQTCPAYFPAWAASPPGDRMTGGVPARTVGGEDVVPDVDLVWPEPVAVGVVIDPSNDLASDQDHCRRSRLVLPGPSQRSHSTSRPATRTCSSPARGGRRLTTPSDRGQGNVLSTSQATLPRGQAGLLVYARLCYAKYGGAGVLSMAKCRHCSGSRGAGQNSGPPLRLRRSTVRSWCPQPGPDSRGLWARPMNPEEKAPSATTLLNYRRATDLPALSRPTGRPASSCSGADLSSCSGPISARASFSSWCAWSASGRDHGS